MMVLYSKVKPNILYLTVARSRFLVVSSHEKLQEQDHLTRRISLGVLVFRLPVSSKVLFVRTFKLCLNAYLCTLEAFNICDIIKVLIIFQYIDKIYYSHVSYILST